VVAGGPVPREPILREPDDAGAPLAQISNLADVAFLKSQRRPLGDLGLDDPERGLGNERRPLEHFIAVKQGRGEGAAARKHVPRGVNAAVASTIERGARD
jgi:hypothetical protein